MGSLIQISGIVLNMSLLVCDRQNFTDGQISGQTSHLHIYIFIYLQVDMGGHQHQEKDPRIKGTPLDFEHKHPVFDINLEKKGPEFSELDQRRAQYIRKYAGRVEVPEPQVPKNIPGLIPRVGPLPSNRRLWKNPTSSFERNGIFNIHTPNFNTRFAFPFFFCFLLYGWWGHPTYGYYKMRHEDNDERPNNMYDKLNTRVPPVSKIWLRPG